MNFNTFFLDKISGTNNLIGLNTNKFNPNAYLFSNVIKIEEANSIQPKSNQTNNLDSLETETNSSIENIIQVSDSEITKLQNILSQFIANTNQPEKSSETAQKLSSVEVNKNKLLINKDELTALIQSVVQNIVSQNQILTKESTINSSTNVDAKSIKTVTQSLLNLLNQVNNLNLSFKSGSQKISIQIVSDTQNAENTNINGTTNSNITGNDLLFDNSTTTNYKLEITQICSKADKAALYSANDSLTNNLKSNQNQTQKDCSVVYTNQTSELSPLYSNNTPLIQANEQQTLSDDKSTIIQVSKNSGTISLPDLQDSSYFDRSNKIQVNIKVGINQMISSNIDNGIVPITSDNTQTSILKTGTSTQNNIDCNPTNATNDLSKSGIQVTNSLPDILIGKQLPDAVNSPTIKSTIEFDNILKTQLSVSSSDTISDNANKSSLQKQITDDGTVKPQKEVSNMSQTPDERLLSQYSEKIKLENISIAQSMPGETIKKLFSDRIVDVSQNIDSQTKTKDAIDQLKDVAGLNQTMKKLSLLDNSNNDVSMIPKSNDINQSSSIDQLLNLKDNTSIKYNNILNATKSCVTEVTDNNVVQSELVNKDLKNQTEITFDKTNNIGQIKDQDQQKELQKREDASIQVKNSVTNEIISQDSQKKDSIQSAHIVDGNRAVNQALDSEIKTAGEVKNSSKIGTSAKDEISKNADEQKAPVSDTQTKNQDDKDFQKQKFAETTKNNSIQNSTNANDFETGKLKVFTDIKTDNETVKTISVSDIIPEFTKAIQQNEKQSLTFQLTPDNLGKVKLVVDLVQNQVNTRIVVENNQIKQFIQSNIEQLKQSLSSSGIDLNSVNISLADHEQKSNKSFSQRKKINGKLESINPTDSQQALATKTLGYNTYEYLV